MKEEKAATISLSTFFLILAIIIIVIMGLFIYKLNNDKTAEIQKSTELQAQINNLDGTLSDLQGKINTISGTINSNTSNQNNNTVNNNKNTNGSNQNNVSKNATTKFSEKEIKDAIQMCLNLESAKTDGPVTILETLGITKNYDYSNEKEEANKSGFIKTTVNFSTFKNAMLKYMTEECYQKQWEDYFENEDGYLCYYNVGASGIAYKVNTIKSTKNGYIANVTASSEGPDWDITVNFAIDDTKCIISYYKLQ